MTFVSDVAHNVGDHHGAPPTSGACLRWRTLFVLLRELSGIGGGAPEKPGGTLVADAGQRSETGLKRGGRPLPTFPSGKELKRMECRER